MSTGETWTLGRRPALDGLRGIAVLLVVLSHAAVPGFAFGGAVGVTMFFALSGFLITTLLLDEVTATGRVALGRFYARRALRLTPALVVCVVVVSAVTVAVTGVFEPSVTFGALGYAVNWLRVDGVWPDLTPLGHTWSLAIEEQFYLLWPLLLLGLVRLPKSGRLLLVAGGVAVSLLLRIVLFDGGAGAARVSFGLDTRADALLVGCFLAVVLHGTSGRGPLRHFGVVGGLVLGLCLLVDPVAAYLYLPTVVAAATALVIWVAAASGGGGRLLTAPTLTLLGRRSYALYLWHAPVLAGVEAAGLPWLVGLGVALPVSWVLTLLSWRYVEEPFLRMRDGRRVSVPQRQLAVRVMSS